MQGRVILISFVVWLVFFWLSDLTEEQKGYQELARKFAAEEIIPKAAYHDQTGEVSSSWTLD